MDSKLNQLAPITDFDKAYVLAQYANENGFRGSTFIELYYWLKDRLDLTGLSNTAGLPEPLPEPGSTLEANNENEWTILEPGTYQKILSGSIGIAIDEVGFAQFDGVDFNRVLKIKLPSAPPVAKPDIAQFAYVKEDYVYQTLVDTAMAPTIRVNGVALSDEIEKKQVLKKLDQCIKSIKVFGEKPGESFLLRQFTSIPATNTIGLGITLINNIGITQDINVLPTAFQSAIAPDIKMPFLKQFTLQYTELAILVTMDMSPFGDDELNLNFRDSSQMGSYQSCGIKDSAIKYLPKKDIWGTGYKFTSAGVGTSWQFPRAYYFHNAVKSITVTSKDKSLVSISGVSYSAANNYLAVVIMTCNDDDPNNLNLTTSRAGFSYLRINIPIADTGIKRYKSYVLTNVSTVEVDMVIDLDYLLSNVPNIPDEGFAVARVGELAQWVVAPGTGGGGGTFTSLSLIEGGDDFQGNFRFAPSTGNWQYALGSNMTKVSRLPEGIESVDFNMIFDGANHNAKWLDKDFKFISWVYSGSESVSFLNAIPPAGALFVTAATTTSITTAKIIAKGLFTIKPEVKEYRSINEGLSDRYSGLVFEVNGFFYRKDRNGLCTVSEYSTGNQDLLNLVPQWEKDGPFIIPQNIIHTDAVNTYSGGTLCAVSNGVMYFYNARYCAIYKSEDNGLTFTTILDKYSHPGVWDEDDIAQESRSAIIVLDNGEIMFPVRHRGDVPIPDSTRNERFYVMYRTTDGQTELEKCFTFSHEDSARTWLSPTDPQYGWPNHSGGCLLGDFTHAIKNNMIVITEYGAGTSKYWSTQVPPTSNNARGVSGRAWVSFDYGITWKKMFDADRKIIGTEEAEDNWFYFTSTYSAKMRHMHGVDIDVIRNRIQLTNGDNEDYIWSVNIADLLSWYNLASAVDPNEKPEYKVTDTFPNWDAKLIVPSNGNTRNDYSSMRAQQMKFVSKPRGLIGAHDASREFIYIAYYNNGELIIEPVFPIEQRADYESDSAFAGSWVSTDGFVQGVTEHEGVTYFSHSNGGTRPSRVWASVDGIMWKVIYEGDNTDIKFAGKILFDGNTAYLSNGTNGQASIDSGYWKLKLK